MNKTEQAFCDQVWEYYHQHGRHDLPWRKKKHLKPYDIVASEVMLQQTQVDRVIPKYEAFMATWPTAKQLAEAKLGDVLRAWQGLGYNRRAKALHECAKSVTGTRGKFPKEYTDLMQLPGIGPYTAAAVRAFAFNLPTALVETNIRTVYLHHFFKAKTNVPDAAILERVHRTLDNEHPREWYWALMDYGSYLKKELKLKNSASKHYVKQSAFKGSDREVRGAILRVLTTQSVTETLLTKQLKTFEAKRVKEQLQKLVAEEMVVKRSSRFQLP